MKAVSNTTPLRYLIAINQVSLLQVLFDRVFIPGAVYEELTDARTPEVVRNWMGSPPAWLQVQQMSEHRPLELVPILHRGELEAILLAELLPADVLLIDEQAGRKIALSRNLPVSGTLGVLEQADRIGLINDFPEILKHLKNSGFFLTNVLEELLLRRHHYRRRDPTM